MGAGSILCFCQLVAAGANVACQMCRVAVDKAMIGHISGHYRARAYHREAAYSNAGDDNRPRTEGCALFHQDVPKLPVIIAFRGAVWVDGPGHLVVCEYNVRSYEDAILKGHAMIDAGAVLYFDVVADLHAKVDIGPLAEDAVAPQRRPLPDLGLVPNLCPITQRSVR